MLKLLASPPDAPGATFPSKKMTNYLERPFQEGPLREQAWNHQGADSTGLDSGPSGAGPGSGRKNIWNLVEALKDMSIMH